jgi:hypothetical protein
MIYFKDEMHLISKNYLKTMLYIDIDILECDSCSSKHKLLDYIPDGWAVNQILRFGSWEAEITVCCNKCNIVKNIIK